MILGPCSKVDMGSFVPLLKTKPNRINLIVTVHARGMTAGFFGSSSLAQTESPE